MNTNELKNRVFVAKKSVISKAGGSLDNLSHEVRSNQIYQNYCGVCGEIAMASEEGELTEDLVLLLEEYAEKTLNIL